MAAPSCYLSYFFVNLCYICWMNFPQCNSLVEQSSAVTVYSAFDISVLSEQSCILLSLDSSYENTNLILQLNEIFAGDAHVSIGSISTEELQQLAIDLNNFNKIVLVEKTEKQRTCLLPPSLNNKPKTVPYHGPLAVDSLVEFINRKCKAFRDENGKLTHIGLKRNAILTGLFKVNTISNASVAMLYNSYVNPFQTKYHNYQDSICNDLTNVQERCHNIKAEDQNVETLKEKTQQRYSMHQNQEKVPLAKCPEVKDLTPEEFNESYLKHSKPFIIRGAANEWVAKKKWTNDFLRSKYGSKEVHVKMTPGGDFEGIERADLWENYESFTKEVPSYVKDQLLYPDLVVVRPAGREMKMEKFLDLIEQTAINKVQNVSAYLEYTSIKEYFANLEDDMDIPSFAAALTKRHVNIWLSDGNTLGRLHFDPYDNLLCQLSGSKRVILYEPYNNTQLYESHIPQATLSYKFTAHDGKHHFRKKSLEDTTAMVMSPVDMLHPDLQRFPEFGATIPLNCTIHEGDLLYMPAFWWHEVESTPSPTEHRNLAANVWYEPFLTKEFPCADCKLDVNPFYHHLL